jgi:hypothetical protein
MRAILCDRCTKGGQLVAGTVPEEWIRIEAAELSSKPSSLPKVCGKELCPECRRALIKFLEPLRYRPRFDQWGARFTLSLDDESLDIGTAHKLLSEAGQHIGIGDFRPEKRGPFGCFRVTHFEESDELRDGNSELQQESGEAVAR